MISGIKTRKNPMMFDFFPSVRYFKYDFNNCFLFLLLMMIVYYFKMIMATKGKMKDLYMSNKSDNQHIDNKFYRWYAGNHCFPKCTMKKALSCESRIKRMLKNEQIKTHRQFIYLLRIKYSICDLLYEMYRKNIYKEPLHRRWKLHE